jgi:hypothetical protein
MGKVFSERTPPKNRNILLPNKSFLSYLSLCDVKDLVKLWWDVILLVCEVFRKRIRAEWISAKLAAWSFLNDVIVVTLVKVISLKTNTKFYLKSVISKIVKIKKEKQFLILQHLETILDRRILRERACGRWPRLWFRTLSSSSNPVEPYHIWKMEFYFTNIFF